MNELRGLKVGQPGALKEDGVWGPETDMVYGALHNKITTQPASVPEKPERFSVPVNQPQLKPTVMTKIVNIIKSQFDDSVLQDTNFTNGLSQSAMAIFESNPNVQEQDRRIAELIETLKRDGTLKPKPIAKPFVPTSPGARQAPGTVKVPTTTTPPASGAGIRVKP